PIWPITAPPRMAKTPKRLSRVAMTSRITPAPITAPDVLLAAGAAGGEGSQEAVGSSFMPQAYAAPRRLRYAHRTDAMDQAGQDRLHRLPFRPPDECGA